MRTTLDVDNDILAVAKELARRQRLSIGRVISRLPHQGLTGQGLPATPLGQAETAIALTTGFRPFPAGRLVTNDQVDALRETAGSDTRAVGRQCPDRAARRGPHPSPFGHRLAGCPPRTRLGLVFANAERLRADFLEPGEP
jgi:hypothetical protein